MRYRSIITAFALAVSMTGIAQSVDISSAGAVGDGHTMNTSVIQRLIDSVSQAGGGNVVVPAGRFLTGAIRLKTGVTLHLNQDAILLGSTNPKDYYRINRWLGLVMADGARNIGITGAGTIDGQGRELALHLDSLFYAGQVDSNRYNFVERRPRFNTRPQLIEFVNCHGIEVRNVTLRNAAMWVQTHDKCTNIVIDNVTTDSDAYWNNDGIDISDCRNVRISNCFVNSADDGICLKSHVDGYMCDSIYIDNCTVRSSASAVKFGTRSHGGFRNVQISNIKVYDTFRSAIAIECVDGGVLEDVVIDGIEARNTGNAIFIRLGKRNKTEHVSQLRNVLITNIDVEVAYERPDYDYEIRGPALPFFHNTFPSSITGIPGHNVENVVLENISIRYPGKGNNGLANLPVTQLGRVPENEDHYPEFSMFRELPAWGLYVRHVEGLVLRNINMSIGAPDYRYGVVFDDVHRVTLENVNIAGDNKEHLVLRNSTGVSSDGSLTKKTVK